MLASAVMCSSSYVARMYGKIVSFHGFELYLLGMPYSMYSSNALSRKYDTVSSSSNFVSSSSSLPPLNAITDATARIERPKVASRKSSKDLNK